MRLECVQGQLEDPRSVMKGEDSSGHAVPLPKWNSKVHGQLSVYDLVHTHVREDTRRLRSKALHSYCPAAGRGACGVLWAGSFSDIQEGHRQRVDASEGAVGWL